jgi:hypothetical protein
MATTKQAPIPGWRTMPSAQRRNAQYDRIWDAAKDAKTRFNESSRHDCTIDTGDTEPCDDLHATAPISDGFTDQRDEDATDQDYCDRAIA